MLATDGRDSFALFIYNDSESVINLTSHFRIVGFSARDEENSIEENSIVINSGSSNGNLAGINIYRIDGMIVIANSVILVTTQFYNLYNIILFR